MKSGDLLELADEILSDIELERLQLGQILLKCLRLARISNDLEALEWLTQESRGFDNTTEGFSDKALLAVRRSNRTKIETEKETGKPVERFYVQPISSIEVELSALSERVKLDGPNAHAYERSNSQQRLRDFSTLLQKIKGALYTYVLEVSYSLRYGTIVESIFERKRLYVDTRLGDLSPDSIKKFVSIYENIGSGNEEDWANGVHTCRRLLKDLADSLFPPENVPRILGGKTVKVGEDNYINRLVCYIEDHSKSESFKSVVGSGLNYVGERIDSIYEATNKGTHSVVTKSEAERYIIHTYLLISDILEIE